jgi:uncharacterized protein (DUF1800 family)
MAKDHRLLAVGLTFVAWLVFGRVAFTNGAASPALTGAATRTVTSTPTPQRNATRTSRPAATPTSTATPARLISYAAAMRFLEQATWGPTPADVANLRHTGFAAWFARQQAAVRSTFPEPPTTAGPNFEVQAFLYNAMHGPDQLRQRMAFTLGQIWVVSSLKLHLPAMAPYLRLLQDNAFANYRQLMQATTLSPSMGDYLDMVNNDKPDPTKGTLPNQNYARELLQLFTIGTVMLNVDGTLRLNSGNRPIPAYDHTELQEIARVFTGWTYPTQPGLKPMTHNPNYFVGPMIPVESEHDMDSKVVFGHTLPGGQTAEQDLEQTLDIIFNHPNVPPFVSLRLIQHFVTSNPSPAYVRRVANVFINNGHGVRGDLLAVLKAVLLDPEARQGDDNIAQQPLKGGHLREPVLYATALLRELGGSVAATNKLGGPIGGMGQRLLYPESVFNYYSPLYRIPGGAMAAPEFQLLTSALATSRANFVSNVLLSPGLATLGATVDLTPFTSLASDPEKLVSAVDLALMRGQMPATMRSTILAAVSARTDPAVRTGIALYLTATSSLYQVEH